MKIAPTLFALLLISAGCANAEENKSPSVKPGGDSRGKVEAVIPAAGQNESGAKFVKNRAWAVSSVRTYCKDHNLPLTELGDGAVHALLIGGVAIKDPAKELIEPAQLALDGLEIWTGAQQQFSKKPQPEDERYNLCIFANDGDFSGFIDFYTNGNPGLSKFTMNTTLHRCVVGTASHSLQILRWWAVYTTSCLAIDAFFFERGVQKVPAWLREGLGADLQRRVCSNQVRIYTISYEESKSDMNGDWSKDIADMIDKRDRWLRPASEVMLMETIKLPGEYYKQMWSLASFVNNQAQAKKGPDNKLMQLFSHLANGESQAMAMKAVFGKEDPVLTKAWQSWAQKR